MSEMTMLILELKLFLSFLLMNFWLLINSDTPIHSVYRDDNNVGRKISSAVMGSKSLIPFFESMNRRVQVRRCLLMVYFGLFSILF